MSFTHSTKNSFNPALIALGLKENPFATSEAEQERDTLGKFFVDVNYYDQIKKNQTQIIFAPRGGGKSTLRVLRANEMAPIQSLSTAFAIEFTDFDRLYSKLRTGEPLQPQDYVDEILRLGAKAIFSFLFEKERTQKRIKKFSISDQARLAKLLWTFSPTTMSLENLFDNFAVLLPGTLLDWDEFCTAVQNFSLRALLSRNALEKNASAGALAFLVDSRREDHHWLPISLKERMDLLVGLIHSLGYQTLVVLLDRIDEISGTVNHPEVQTDLLVPLLAHLPIMEAPDVCFKLFIPSNTRDVLMSRPEIRRDRLHDLEISVEWSNRLLRKLLERRLKSLAGITELDEICGDKPDVWPTSEKSLGEIITDEMVELAQGSPRRLILAGQMLLEAYSLHPNRGKILWEDWETARRVLIEKNELSGFESLINPPQFSNGPKTEEQPQEEPVSLTEEGIRTPPLLYISKTRPEVRLREQIIRVTPTESLILGSLVSHKGYCHVEVLHDEVWQNAVTDSGLDAALARLRKKINNSLSAQPSEADNLYLEKKSKFVMLHNYLVEED